MKNATILRVLMAILLLSGLSFAQVDSLIYEVVQTNPPLGTPPTANDGFCSSSGGALGCTNVQRYIRLDPDVGSGNINGVWLSAGNDVAPLLRQFGIDSIYATFTNNIAYTVLVIDVNGAQSVLGGTFTATASGVGDIFNITLNQITPTALTSEGIFEIKTVVTGIEDGDDALPQTFALEQNYPNPFNPATTIAFELPKSANVSLKVFNLAGQEVAEVLNGNRTAGRHEVTFDAASLPSGVYFYRIQAGEFTATRKMMLVR